MRRNLFLQIATMILLVTLSSCDWDIFGKEKNFKKPSEVVNQAKDKAGHLADDLAGSFDPKDPKYDGMSEEEIRAKELESGLFDEVMEMQDEAMGKLSELKKMQKNLAAFKGASSSGYGGKEVGSYSASSSSSKGSYQCPFAEEARMSGGNSYSEGGGSNSEVVSTISKLKKAEDSLYKFMNNFDKPEDLPHEEAIEYFESEKEKMTSIKDDVFESMEEGEALLQTLE